METVEITIEVTNELGQISSREFNVDPEVKAQLDAQAREVRDLKTTNSTIRRQTVLEREADFVQKVMDYSSGCTDGKIEFLKECGYELPTRKYFCTVTVTLSMSEDINDIESEIESTLRSAEGVTDSYVSSFEEC